MDVRPLEGAQEPPPAIRWFRVYCGGMIALYLLCTVGGVVFWYFAPELARDDSPEWMNRFMGIAIAVWCAILAAAYAIPFFLSRTKGAWIYSIVLIGFGFTSCLTLVPAIFLLLAWLKPELQAQYGYGQTASPPPPWRPE